jgi:glyoxylase-like metal-dependent hydrolase (beta-lactamase superfamily II)
MTGFFIEGLPLWLAQTNCWLVAPQGPGGECVLVDAPPDPQAILDRLAHHDLRLVALLSTHGHIDHIGGVGTLVHHHGGGEAHAHRWDGSEVRVHIHDRDRHMLLDPLGTSGMFGQYLQGLDLRPPEVVYGLDDGDQVRGAGMTFTCLHTPGHTPGSVCLRLDVDGQPPILFSGDHLFAGSIGRTDLPGGSFEQLMGSMADKILPLPDELAVLPGHGQTTTLGWERRTNPFLVELQQGGR